MPAQAGIQSPWLLPPGFPLPYQVRDKLRGNDARSPAIPAEPSSPVITVSADLAFRKHRCENTPLT